MDPIDTVRCWEDNILDDNVTDAVLVGCTSGETTDAVDIFVDVFIVI